nr:MAG TPA: hypothetical protein [Caudoviricetes sp.]
MVKVKGYVLSENDRAAVRRVVAKVGDTPLSGAALKSRHRPEADADYSYSGYFKVIPGQAEGTLRIVDGANQNAAICGKTDVGDVPMETLTSQEGTLYLIMKPISATTYTQTFEWMIPSGAVGWTEIATVDSDGVITQRWTGNTIYWGQRYLI